MYNIRMQDTPCPSCKYVSKPDWHFCPNCGKVLIEKPPSTTFFKQLMIYSISFFLAPLGIGWGIKYIRSRDKKAKIVGWIAIILTVVSIALMFLSFQAFMTVYM